MNNENKLSVKEFWNKASCGEELYLNGNEALDYREHAKKRYELEPYILNFAKFNEAKEKKVLEIGVGLGADHQQFAEAGALLHGLDLTERAVEHTRRRLAVLGQTSQLSVGDAENLDFPDAHFDVVYSWGVLHHSPDTSKAIQEVWRVLRPGGVARIMVYHTWSLVGLMLWVRYALFGLRPLMSMREIYSRYLESPGTKAYTFADAHELFAQYETVRMQTVLTHGDLLESEAGQRHKGALLDIARKVWPRWFFKRFMSGWGLFLLIEAYK